jgi:hypothetical protein
MNKTRAVVLALTLILTICTSYYFINQKLSSKVSEILAAILSSEAQQEDINQFAEAIEAFKCGRKIKAWSLLDQLEKDLGSRSLEQITLESSQTGTNTYRGIFCNDVRDARTVLANIDKAKQDGFDTIWLQAEIEPTNPIRKKFYVPGKEAYLFYLNAFRKADFRIILSVGHTAYPFPYGRGERAKEKLYPLENRFQAYEVVEPLIMEWAEIAEEQQVDIFIPLEEANKFALTDPQESVNLTKEEREFVSAWAQEIREKVSAVYPGKLGFATNDGGCSSAQLVPCQQEKNKYCSAFEWSEGKQGWVGPDFDYRNYNYLVTKVPFYNAMKSKEAWLYELHNRLNSCNYYADRDSLERVIWYEAGMPVGNSVKQNEQNHKTMTEEERKFAIQTTFELAEQYNIEGIFFKPSPAQIHEGDWNFFGTESEQIIRDNFAPEGTIEPHRVDSLWTKLGDESIKTLQDAITKKKPFDPADYVK